MRINPYSNPSSVDAVSNQAKAAKPATSSSSSVSGSGEADGFSRSTALSGLINALRDLPEVRSDALEAVRLKIAAGELDTQNAYAEAAVNIVDTASADSR